MRQEQDAFGLEIYRYLQRGQGSEIVERDDGYITVGSGPAAYFAPLSDWPVVEQEGITLVQGRTLDVGCGAGRVCLHLQEQGIEAVGIDNSPLAIRTAQLRGVQDARVLSITQVSRKALGVFHAVVMFGNNFGLFGNRRRARWLLRRFHGMTTAGARILAASRDTYSTDDPDHLAYHERNRQRGRMAGQVRIRIRYHTRLGPWFDYLQVSPDEMAAIAAGTGWSVARIIREPDDAMYVGVLEKG